MTIWHGLPSVDNSRSRETRSSRSTSTSDTRSRPVDSPYNNSAAAVSLERAQFLDLSQAEGEDVIERRFVDAAQQAVEQLDMLRGARAVEHAQLFAVRVARRMDRVARDGELAERRADLQPAAGAPAVHGGQITAALRRKAVENGPHELQQRGLAGFVRPVEGGQPIGKIFEPQPGPNAEAVDFQFE